MFVKRVELVLSPEAAAFIRDAILDSADFVEDAINHGDVSADAIIEGQKVDAANVINELRRAGRHIDRAILTPSTISEYNEILNIN